MQTKYGFTNFSVTEFENWIENVSVGRTIVYLQQHHTWKPRYANFTGSNHFELQRNMKNYHVGTNGWSDIGQHFTIFPDGKIMTGRKLNRTPACIYGNNSSAVCIENLGDFDNGRDAMTAEQEEAVIRTSAAVIKRFSMIKRDARGIIYHHWFDLNTGQRRNGAGSTKSCPGTNFFGGNKVAEFNDGFLPKVLTAIADGTPMPAPLPNSVRFVHVDADFLNIRTGPKSTFPVIDKHGPAELGSILRVFEEQNGWFKISNSKDHWVYSRYTSDVTRGIVNTDDSKVRSGPGTSHSVMDAHDMGELVFIHETSGNWYRIGANLWIHASLVD